MLAQSRLQIQYGNFCQIFNEVMLPKYSLAEREEMMRLLEDQTLANHLHFLKEQAASRTEDITDLVWRVVQHFGVRPFACQELFLEIFDKATEIHDQSRFKEELVCSEKISFNSSKDTKTNTSERDTYLTRMLENLREENELLRSEIEEKAKTIDESASQLKNLKTQMRRYSEAFARLENEKMDLKNTIDTMKSSNIALIDSSAEKELLLRTRVEDLESELAEKKEECAELLKEHIATVADVNTLSCEIGERDLVISSLTSKLEEAALVLEEKEELCQTPSRSDFPPWRNSPDCSPIVLKDGICLEQELEQVSIHKFHVSPKQSRMFPIVLFLKSNIWSSG